MLTGCYEILNTTNGKRYVGSAKDFGRRWTAHRNHLLRGSHHSRHLQSAWNRYGESSFKFLPILTCQPSMLLFYEQQLLDKVKPEYNVLPTAGSQLGAKRALGFQIGRVQSAETRRKLSAWRTGKKNPEVAAANSERVISDESRQKMSAARKGRPHSLEHAAKIAASLVGNTNARGVKRSPEAIEKTAAANRGKILSAETRRKISVAQKARFATTKQLSH